MALIILCGALDGRFTFSNQISHSVTSIMLLVSVSHHQVFFQLLTSSDHWGTCYVKWSLILTFSVLLVLPGQDCRSLIWYNVLKISAQTVSSHCAAPAFADLCHSSTSAPDSSRRFILVILCTEGIACLYLFLALFWTFLCSFVLFLRWRTQICARYLSIYTLFWCFISFILYFFLSNV